MDFIPRQSEICFCANPNLSEPIQKTVFNLARFQSDEKPILVLQSELTCTKFSIRFASSKIENVFLDLLGSPLEQISDKSAIKCFLKLLRYSCYNGSISDNSKPQLKFVTYLIAELFTNCIIFINCSFGYYTVENLNNFNRLLYTSDKYVTERNFHYM